MKIFISKERFSEGPNDHILKSKKGDGTSFIIHSERIPVKQINKRTLGNKSRGGK